MTPMLYAARLERLQLSRDASLQRWWEEHRDTAQYVFPGDLDWAHRVSYYVWRQSLR